MKRECDKSFANTPSLAAHMAATGERPPSTWFRQPADMRTHLGYEVRREGQRVAGPFAWFENAEREAPRLGGVIVRVRKAEVA